MILSIAEWEGVYNEYVKDKDNVLVKPGYTDPKSFTWHNSAL